MSSSDRESDQPSGAAPPLRQRLQQAADLLEAAGVGEARPSAERLLLHVLGRERSFLYAHPEYLLTPTEGQQFAQLIEERAQGVPVQYLVGHQEFFGREFFVTPDVLIPRPETEQAVETLLGLIPSDAPALLADVGTGSGCIAVTLALERPCARVLATDLSPHALQVARENARRLGAENVKFLHGDLLQPILDAGIDSGIDSGIGGMDGIISNPPYIGEDELAGLQREVRDFEPRMALTPGRSGLEAYARIIPQAEKLLRPGGWLVLELGFRSADGVRALLGAEWDEVAVLPDLQGWDRVLRARKRPSAAAQ
jgi:release factor glutamine methyltransferase